jgi:hypothetical protein
MLMKNNESKVYTSEEALSVRNSIEGAVIITGIIEGADEKSRQNIQSMFGVSESEVNECFNLYFHWFNVIHELSHIMASNNGVQDINDIVRKETMVNRIAASFLREFGDIELYKRLQLVVDNAQKQLESPIPVGVSFDEYFSKYTAKSDRDMSQYAFFQITIVENLLDSTESIYEVLNQHGIIINKIPENSKLRSINKNIGTQQIIDEASAIFIEMGLVVPKVTVIFCDNPLIHCAPRPHSGVRS